jgi:hypothetical protein
MTVNAESVVATLSAMEGYFRGGHGWGRFQLHNPLTGRKCLQGAVSAVRVSDGCRSWVPSEAIEAARRCIQVAVREHGWRSIEDFNDTRLSYRQIAAVIARAKELAMSVYPRAAAPCLNPARPAEILPPPRRAALTHQPERPVEVVTLADMERVALKR